MIEVIDLWKVFKVYHNPADRLKEIIFRRKYSKEYIALKGINFTVKEGETLGIIGENGAGKSTILKILTGILYPTKGIVKVHGRITGLLELGTGFNPELTGIKNIYMNGMLIGMSKEEIDKKLQSIIDFSELGDFIEEPIKTYSSGMLMRLAFSIAIHAEPKAFVVDEALAVGDAYFQQKCIQKIQEFKESGGSIVFVSHDMNAVKLLCNKAILLNKGTAIEEGDPKNVISTYNFLIAKKSKGEEIKILTSNQKSLSYGNMKIKINKIEFFNEAGIDSRIFIAGEKTKIRIYLEATEDVEKVVVGILIRDRFGQDIFGTNSYHLQKPISLKKEQKIIYEYSFNLNIGIGEYTLTIAAHKDETHINETYHWCDNILKFKVAGFNDYKFTGLSKLNVKLDIVH